MFLFLLETHIDIDKFIPISFRNHFCALVARTHKYHLQAFLWASIIQCIFSILQASFSWLFLLTQSRSMNSVVLPKSRMHPKIIRFKQNFLNDLQLVFDNLVDITDPICQAIGSVKADMTIFDSSGIEAPATDNNPNYVNTIIKQLKAYAKVQSFDKSYALSKEVCVSMSSYASSNPQIKQLYSKLLVSTLKDSFSKHPLINQKHFLAMHLSIQ